MPARASEQDSQKASPSVGKTPTAAQIAGWNIDVLPDGTGLPAGKGTVSEGKKIYAAQCAACHGANLEGMPIAPRLVGGIGTLTNDIPTKTVGSFWPYATGVFDYIRRAMPLTAPGSLKSNELYSVVAFILSQNGIVPADAVLDAKTLPAVKMPNRDGFYPSVESEKLAKPRGSDK
ncbi:c-type cytochrome [Cupriavidus metallidurans]|nr:cytochrome c [Cupriavidus metallidurans]